MLRTTRLRGKPRRLCLLLALLCCVPAYAQIRDENVFAPLPPDLRAGLGERLKLLIEYQRTQQWEKQYELLSVTATQGDNREEYAERTRRWYTKVVPEDLLLDFVPKSMTVHESSADAGWLTLYGCGKLRKQGQIVELYASVEAHRERGEWFFSTIGVVTPVGGKPRPCETMNASGRPS